MPPFVKLKMPQFKIPVVGNQVANKEVVIGMGSKGRSPYPCHRKNGWFGVGKGGDKESGPIPRGVLS